MAWALRALGFLVLAAACLSCSSEPPVSSLWVKHEAPPIPVAVGEVVELAFQHNGNYANPFFDAKVEVEFRTPDGRSSTRNGFYHSGDVWAVRVRPDAPGEWKYGYRFSSRGEVIQSGEGGFHSTPAEYAGRIRVHPSDPYRWVFENGQPYFPVGIQDCFALRNERLSKLGVDGEDRSANGSEITIQEYLALYGKAGFNLFRFSQRNCSYLIYDTLDTYNVNSSLVTDEILSAARTNGLRVMFGFFGYHDAWNGDGGTVTRALHYLQEKVGLLDEAVSNPGDKRTLGREQRFVDYCIARWGVYADFWELLNERDASDEWTRLMAAYVQSVDPDRKPISTSWEKPKVAGIGINAPHWYTEESEKDSDLRVHELAVKWKEFGKPVLVGEHGNMGMNWTPDSGTRMRIRSWTAMFEEIGLVFWNTSYSKNGMNGGRYTPGAVANIYLGPAERSYIANLQGFASHLDGDVVPAPVEVSTKDSVRGYGLVSSHVAAAYLHHFQDHANPIAGLKVKLAVPQPNLRFAWIDPATGAVLSEGPVGGEELAAPPFAIDLALLISRDRMPRIK